MIFKIVILSLLLVVLVSLGSALAAMAKGDKTDKMLKSLTWRIGISVSIFMLLLIAVLFKRVFLNKSIANCLSSESLYNLGVK